jgi:NADP-reducing hydrogenase subunit HndB
MAKITSLDQLKKIHADEKRKIAVRSDLSHPEHIIQVKVTMATCGIASGSKQILDFMKDELEKRNISAIVTKTGCMGYCYAEPTIEVTKPGKEPVTFGYVNQKKADEIIEKYIRKGESVDGMIPMTFEKIDSIK